MVNTPTVTTSQVAIILGISKPYVRQLAQRGFLTRVGKRMRETTYPLDQVQQFQKTRTKPNGTLSEGIVST